MVDLIGLIGYYHIVSMALNLDRYPLPNGEKPPLGSAFKSPSFAVPILCCYVGGMW